MPWDLDDLLRPLGPMLANGQLLVDARTVLGLNRAHLAKVVDKHPWALGGVERSRRPVEVTSCMLQVAALGIAARRVLAGEAPDLLSAYVYDPPVRLWSVTHKANRKERAESHGFWLAVAGVALVTRIDHAVPANDDTIAARCLVRTLGDLLEHDVVAGFPVLRRTVSDEQ